MGQEDILQLNHITKLYPGVTALDDVSISFKRGEIHALLGENGAGKSTLIKTITGAIVPTSGEIIYKGETYTHFTPTQTLGLGIAAIYQELNLIPSLTVAENIFFGCELQKGVFLDRKEMNRRTAEILDDFGIHIDPDVVVGKLGVAQQQIIEIAKSMSKNLELIIMDEPTATLTNAEIKIFFQLIRRLREKNITVVFISHHLPELFEICDCVTIMRDGKYITTKRIEEATRQELVALMVGRELGEHFPERTKPIGVEPILEVRNLTNAQVRNISFQLYPGEILGVGGLVGAGRTEMVRAIFGADPKDDGSVILRGMPVQIRRPSDAISLGIGLIPEDRKAQGVILGESVKENIVFPSLKKISVAGWVRRSAERKISKALCDSLRVKTPSLEQKVKNLSGGNQQKVVLAKWLAVDSDVLIFDEPTRGIDVGAKQEIYGLMRELASAGKGILVISSEMPELLGMSDRVLVLCDGAIAGELDREQATQERVIAMASGEELLEA